MDPIRDVLDFWFLPGDGPEFAASGKRWYMKDQQFDEEIRQRFLALHESAAAGQLNDWGNSVEGTLALLILLDQFPRNMFRDSPRAFATDGKALSVARHAVNQGVEMDLPPAQRAFFYLPFEHSEDLNDQEICLRLTQAMPNADASNSLHFWAVKHHAIVARFGRFPHRNAALHRESTAEEVTFLTEPGSSF